MICPLKFNLPYDTPPQMNYDCEKEKCAWWVDKLIDLITTTEGKGTREQGCVLKILANKPSEV